MKKFKTFMVLAFVMLFSITTWGQQSQNQAYWIHVDNVKPSMRAEYENLSKELVKMCRENDLQDIMWNVASVEDGTYMAITPVKDLGEIQKFSFDPLKEKVGEEKFNQLFQDFDKCYTSHGDYMAILNSDLSYMPQGLSPVTPGQEYRVWHHLNATPAQERNLKGKLVELRDLFKNKGSKMYYRIYNSGFGNIGNGYTAVISAKDAADYARMSSENQQLLGEDGKKLFEELMDHVTKYEVRRGEMRPDLAYNPQPAQPLKKD